MKARRIKARAYGPMQQRHANARTLVAAFMRRVEASAERVRAAHAAGQDCGSGFCYGCRLVRVLEAAA